MYDGLETVNRLKMYGHFLDYVKIFHIKQELCRTKTGFTTKYFQLKKGAFQLLVLCVIEKLVI